MTGSSPKPPPGSFAEAEESFRTFLAANGYPSDIQWLTANQVVLGENQSLWIQGRGKERGHSQAAHRYSAGLKKEFGIALRALCASDTLTFATVYIPIDEIDAEHRRMRSGLKLSCPKTLVPASTIGNTLRWWLLSLRNYKRSKALREFHEL